MKKFYVLIFSCLCLLGFSQSYLPILNVNWRIEKIEKNNTFHFPSVFAGFGMLNKQFSTITNSDYFHLSSGLYNSTFGEITWNETYFKIPSVGTTFGVYEGTNYQAVQFFDGLIFEFYRGTIVDGSNSENYYFTYNENSNGKNLIVSRTNGDKIFYTTELLGTAETSKSKISVYPNPATDIIKIENLKPNSSLELIDNSGKLVKTISNSKSTKTEVNIKNLPSGVYYLKVDGQSVQKIIKK